MSRLGVLHISDLHLTKAHYLESKVSVICNAVKNDWLECESIVIVVSGDISATGSSEEFLHAKTFLIRLRDTLIQLLNFSSVDFVIVPGNHDCDFSSESQLRKSIVNNIDYVPLGDDKSVINCALSVQNNFWLFYSDLMHEEPNDKLLWTKSFGVGTKNVSFMCINSAWMSSMSERYMFFPCKHYNEYASDANVDIAVFHHPIEWFSPNTVDNNRNEIQSFIDKNAGIVLTGHEHEKKSRKTSNISESTGLTTLSAPALFSQSGKISSGFQTVCIDVDDLSLVLKEYEWDGSRYKATTEEESRVDRNDKNKASFILSEVFRNKLKALNISIASKTGKIAALDDLYVFPDLDSMKKSDAKIQQYDDSQKLYKIAKDIIIIEGESQSGKTSLASMLVLQANDFGLFPIFLSGTKTIIGGKLKSSIEYAYLEQYSRTKKTFEDYRQFDNNYKILIVDDVSPSEISNADLTNSLKEAGTYFSKIYVFTSNSLGWRVKIESMQQTSAFYRILPLGFLKRNQLNEKYHSFYEDNSIDVESQDFLDVTKHSCDAIKQVVRNQIIPAYPVFILSILQTLSKNRFADVKQTSYGYCYQTLIHYALVDKAKVSNDKIDSYFHILTELSYWLYNLKREYFTSEQFDAFYRSYRLDYVGPDSDVVKRILLESNLIREDCSCLKFSYPYIYYFLTAKKISDIIHKVEAKEIVAKLSNNLNQVESANILIFISHHTKDIYLINETIFAAMLPFEDRTPATLDIHGEYYKLIQDAIKKIASDVLHEDVNPRAERVKSLQSEDKRSTDTEVIENKSVDSSDILAPILQSFRSMEILGQIVKNRHGSIEIPRLKEMIEEVYLVGFRTLSYFGEELIKAKQEFIDAVNADDEKKRHLKYRGISDIEESLTSLLQNLSYALCRLLIFRVSQCVGQRDLKELYFDISKKISSPISHLTTFAISTSVSKMQISDLETIVEEVKNNPVAKQLLHDIIRNYVYTNNIDLPTKNRIASIAGLTLRPSIKLQHQRV